MDSAFPLLEIMGIIAFAISGISVAKAAGLDMFGTYSCALITALGGGTVRDILIDHRPFYWVLHEWLLLFILILVGLSYAPRLQRLYGPLSSLTCIGDAIGTGIFAISGLQLALTSGFGPLASILMAVITAIVGGVLRDVSCGEIPHVFQRTELCATCAIAGSIVYFGVIGLHVLPAFILASIITAVFRYVALVKKVRLPA